MSQETKLAEVSQAPLVVHDADRCLFDPDLSINILRDIVDSELKDALSGGQPFFNPDIALMEATGGDRERINGFYRQFLKTEADILYPDAEEYLNRLGDKIAAGSLRAMIMTAGNETWQRAKLRVSGLDLDMACLVVDGPDKGRQISEWAKPNRSSDRLTFRPPVEKMFGSVSRSLGDQAVFSHVVLVEDKEEALKGLPKMPEFAKAVLLDRAGKYKGAETGANQRISGLDELRLDRDVIKWARVA